ncbi:MAG TPA: aryl-sulfate sulfotransferase [Bryobacteraceae bacterium]|nr:aryl-sulfate sulfotransferase [Bryobacteraceae bacterium]
MQRILMLGAVLCAPVSAWSMSVTLAASLPSPQPLGTPVTWTADVSGAAPGTLWYRYRATYTGLNLRGRTVTFGYNSLVDFGPNQAFTWSTIAREGPYEIEVTVRNLATGESATATAPFVLTSLVTGDQAVLTPTANPLVYIYSVPQCRGRVRVQTTSPEGTVAATPFEACDSRYSVNFYVTGMRANTTYQVQPEMVDGASTVIGPPLTVTTASLPIQAPQVVPPAGVPVSTDILLHSIVNSNPVATDLAGNIVWYAPFALTTLTRPAPGGTFLGTIEDGTKDPSQQIFRHFDLSGATIAETNAARVSEQLQARGMHPITCFHHEAIALPNGNYLVLAGTERILRDVQGPGDVDVLGDIILVLDPNLQVVWAWDAFDHLDPHRQAILGETCTYPASVACSNFYQASKANDWLHGNALQLTPDGNILYSARHQDWIVKIDYRDGAGTGAILWRMGSGGDFQIHSSDAWPWFSHQHDPNFLADNQTLLVFDNGNTRIMANPTENSRAQVFQVDEANRTVTPVVNTDLGVNSAALGTAERLPDGTYHFNAGFYPDPAAPMTRITNLYELSASGGIDATTRVYAQEYRNFRMTDLYTPPAEWVP